MHTIFGLGVSTVKYVFLSIKWHKSGNLSHHQYYQLNSSRLKRPSLDNYHELSVKWNVMSGLCTHQNATILHFNPNPMLRAYIRVCVFLPQMLTKNSVWSSSVKSRSFQLTYCQNQIAYFWHACTKCNFDTS